MTILFFCSLNIIPVYLRCFGSDFIAFLGLVQEDNSLLLSYLVFLFYFYLQFFQAIPIKIDQNCEFKQ